MALIVRRFQNCTAVAWLMATTSLVACGSSATPAANSSGSAAQEGKAPAAAATTPQPPETGAEHQPATDTNTEATSTAPVAAEKSEADADNRQRQVFYRTTPEGMAVSLEGVEFRAKAEPVKLKNGGFGIRLSLEAEAKDDSMHTLMAPKDGPLAIAGTIKRKKGGEPVKFGDERSGEDEQFIAPGSPLQFERTWPGTDGPFAWYGDEIELQVGLWGVGAAGERRRPVRRLFIVKMMAMQGAKPVLMPPRM